MDFQTQHQISVELSTYLNGLQHLFEAMPDGPIETIEAFEMVQLLKTATEKAKRLADGR